MSTAATNTSAGPDRVMIGKDSVPPMAIGTWSWGDKMVWSHKDDDFAKIRESWNACNKQGLTFYDTAEVYGEGESERIIGLLIKETDEKTKKKLFIATKFLPFPRPASLFLFTPPLVRNLRRSLERLGLDSIDMYQLHSPTGLNSFESYASGLAECYKLGLCRHIGISNFSLDEMIKFADLLAKHDVPLASNQVEFSLLRKLPETSGLLAECKKRNIALLAYSPLGMGRLTGKYSSENPPPSGRRFASQYTWKQLDPLIALLREIATRHNVTPSAVAINWVMMKGAIPLGGARDGKQAEQNASAMTFRLTEDEMSKLDASGFEGTTSRFWQHG